MKPCLLVVDDEEDIRTQMKWGLTEHYEVLLAGDRPGAIQALRESGPQVVLLDLGLPPSPATPKEGLDTLSQILALDRFAKVIIVSGQSEKDNALKAIGQGAYDFLCKPVNMEEMQIILRRAFHVAQLEREYVRMQHVQAPDSFENMLGNSPHMLELFAAIRKVAPADVPVLVLGESGTGKEMAALAIHRRSANKEGPFVPINCGAIPENLLESELFGHEKGSFTGAHAQRKGRVESAQGGTLFLDEIGELPLSLQVKLLRFLQEHKLQRVGGRQEIQVDTRVIAATNSQLSDSVKAGKFREDLYYRLAVVVLTVPPLRERGGDLSFLAMAFLQKFRAECKKDGLQFNADALHAIEAHGWPGNVRELENRVRRAVIMADGRRITAADLELSQPETAPRTLREAREELERQMVIQALGRNRDNISAAAAELGISRPTLYELLEKLGVKR